MRDVATENFLNIQLFYGMKLIIIATCKALLQIGETPCLHAGIRKSKLYKRGKCFFPDFGKRRCFIGRKESSVLFEQVYKPLLCDRFFDFGLHCSFLCLTPRPPLPRERGRGWMNQACSCFIQSYPFSSSSSASSLPPDLTIFPWNNTCTKSGMM